MGRPVLPSSVSIQPGLDVDDLFERFEVFEALHHGLEIASPMSSADLDAVVDLLEPVDGDVAVDLACGGGALLLRLAERARIRGSGVDLSPWMIAAAVDRARGVHGLDWIVGEARDHRVEGADLVACLGASWVWHGLGGTVRAVAERVRPGGRVAIGDMRRSDAVNSDTRVRLPGASEIDVLFDEHELDVLGRITTSAHDWDGYLERTRRAFERWADVSQSPRAEEYRDVLGEWEADQRRDREVLVWSVWVGRRRAS